MRRWAGALALALLVAGAAPAAATARHVNAIRRENRRPGLEHWTIASVPAGEITGYGSSVTVAAGARLPLHVASRYRYRIRVLRLGWYAGAGARLIECLPSCRGAYRPRSPGPLRRDEASGEVTAAWPVSATIRTRREWTSGEYLAELVLVAGPDRGGGNLVPFVVRDPAPSSGSILVDIPVNTWEAYNAWGGKSLYDFNSTHHRSAVRVSFLRPWDGADNNDIFPVGFEYPLLRFLERSGFPLDYVTDVDLDRDPRQLLAHPLSLVLGHGEYWSPAIRSAWAGAERAGRNVAFLGANTGYWQLRYADARRTLVEYRDPTLDPDPVAAEKTTSFRSLVPPEPECALEGVEFQGGGITGPFHNSFRVAAATSSWVRRAGLRAGQTLAGAVRFEWDAVQPGCGNPTVLFDYAGRSPADTVVMRGSGGGEVLSLGTLGFGELVDGWQQARCGVNPGVQRFLRFALADLSQAKPGELAPLRTGC